MINIRCGRVHHRPTRIPPTDPRLRGRVHRHAVVVIIRGRQRCRRRRWRWVVCSSWVLVIWRRRRIRVRVRVLAGVRCGRGEYVTISVDLRLWLLRRWRCRVVVIVSPPASTTAVSPPTVGTVTSNITHYQTKIKILITTKLKVWEPKRNQEHPINDGMDDQMVKTLLSNQPGYIWALFFIKINKQKLLITTKSRRSRNPI